MNPKEYRVIPQILISEREKKDWSQAQLAEEISKHLSNSIGNLTISQWETGRRPVPHKYNEILAKVFDCSVDYLAGYETESLSNLTRTDDIAKIRIPFSELSLYDGYPVYVEFKNYDYPDGWAICDFQRGKKRLHFKDRILTIAINDNDNIKYYIMEPIYYLGISISNRKCATLKQLRNKDSFMVSMLSNDPTIQALYNGWYHHNEDMTAIINDQGRVLPYQGLNKTYIVYMTSED